VPGDTIDLRKVWAGGTEYGTDWHVPVHGGHTLTAGATGSGKNSIGWCPLVSIAPAIRDGLVRDVAKRVGGLIWGAAAGD